MAKRRDIASERRKKQSLWLERIMRITGFDESKAAVVLNIKRTQSIRVNPLKMRAQRHVLGEKISWCPDGYALNPTVHPEQLHNLVQSGEVYIQNAASWLPVLALDPKPSDHILDVCAAPGGKASHIQAITNNQSMLTCNDNSKPRLMKLQANMTRLGAIASYTLCDAARLSRQFEPESFDKILLDAPCSGEGLMTLHDEDIKLFDSWSVAHIRRLSDLQKKILSESWKLLKPGGTLVYSTCTMAPEENEAVIDYFLRKHPDSQLEPIVTGWHPVNRVPAVTAWNGKDFETTLHNCLRLVPGDITEAFFVTKLTKQ